MRAVLAFLFVLIFSAGAAAQSCGALRAELASAKSGQPDRAAVAALTRQAQSAGCGGIRFGRGNPACGRIEAQLRAARRGSVDRNKVGRIMQQIRDNCGTRQARAETRSETGGVNRSAKSGRNIFSNIFGGRNEPAVVIQEERSRSSKSRNVERVNLDVKRSAGTESKKSGGSSSSKEATRSLATGGSGRVKGSSREGSSRTMCVRLCDGFYFPINSRSHSDNYYDEMAMCVGRCPGSDVSLYVQYSGEPVERMRSAMTGEAYVNLPTAFDYRKSLSPSCGCSNGTRIARGDAGVPGTAVASAATASPSADDTTMTDATKDQTRWTRLQAVYDETGEPLPISRTAYGAKEARSRIVQQTSTPVPVGSAPVGAAQQPEGPSVSFDPYDKSARPVGPQFFSETVAEFAARKSDRREVESTGVITTITVTPLNRKPAPAAATPAAEPPAAAAVPAAEAVPAPEHVKPTAPRAGKATPPPDTAAMIAPAGVDG